MWAANRDISVGTVLPTRRVVLAALSAVLVVVGVLPAGRAEAAAPGVPWGSLSLVTTSRSVAHVTGVAADPNTRGGIRVVLTIDGFRQTAVTASGFNAQFGRRHPFLGPRHGFAAALPVWNGTHSLCATAGNVGAGHDVRVGCVQVTGQNNPAGAITGTGHVAAGVSISGWAVDPNASGAVSVALRLDGAAAGTVAAGRPATLPGPFAGYGTRHGFAIVLPASTDAHTVCATELNVGMGHNIGLGCRAVPRFVTTPAAPQQLTATGTTTSSVSVQWAAPGADGGAAVTGYRVTRAGAAAQLLPASAGTATLSRLAPARTYTVGVAAVNAIGVGAPATVRVTTAGSVPSAPQQLAGTTTVSSIALTWAAPADDGDVPVTGYQVRLNGGAAQTVPATQLTATLGQLDPATPYSLTVAAVNAVGVGPAAPLSLHTGGTVPSIPRSVTTSVSPSSITVHWAAPANTGGVPITKYLVHRSGGGIATLPATASSFVMAGLHAATGYTVTVTAGNVVGTGPAASTTVTTAVAIPPQTSPAPVSTSHYLRNLTGNAATDTTLMRQMGAYDAGYNPSGHRYLVLQDIGAQSGNGVLLSTTTRWVSYSALVTAMKAYIDGYASTQKPNAPMLIAIGTNNDGSVSAATGASWARQVINPIRSYAGRYPAISVAGANDIEPGFYAGVSASRAWLSGYLGATGAQFVFNGSADGCPTSSGTWCNNGWRVSDLYWLSGGADPGRILSLPQIYNTVMPWQWRLISASGTQKVNFAGPLTEWTACDQSSSCGSISNVYAWQILFKALNSTTNTAMSAMPYGTDLRIN